ncbi:Hint domain-containing protein [Albidovulum sp.]|uniref:Hint domain-containing protein n=1 Tax=Albidovulum sp. TaxID=1872424 RepID=UPI0039B9C75C
MTWLRLWRREAPILPLSPAPLPPRLDWGTLVLEIDLAALARARGPILRLPPDPAARRIFTLEPSADGRLHLIRRQGSGIDRVSVGLGRDPGSGILRLSYHWDSHRRRSLLTAENLTRGTIRQQEAATALPLRAEDFSALLAPAPGAPSPHPGTDWVGLADHWQAVGPLPGLAPDTPVATPLGPRPVSALRPGDRVRTADDGDGTVLWQGRINAPDIGGFRSVRFRAACFGLAQDIVLRAAQPVAVGGADVLYLFGEDEALVEARHLVNGRGVTWEPGTQITASHGIVLDRPSLIRAGSIWVESLYLGGLARNPGLAQTTAAGTLAEAGRMPHHPLRSRRQLRPFEAVALARARDAVRSTFAA